MINSVHHGRVPRAIEHLLAHAVEELASLRGVRHAILGVEPGDRSYRCIGAAGIADSSGAPMTPETPGCLASVTKLYIGAATLRLEELGRLSIDDPLTDHLSSQMVSGLHQRRRFDRTADLTLRHLLGHASELPEYLSEALRGKKRCWIGLSSMGI